MANILKQSTQIKVRVGPAVDATDAVTPETGLALATADQAELLKADGAATVDISGATFAAVTGCDGWYDLTLTTSHTDTIGELVVVIQDSSLMLPIFARFQVVEEAIYDALFASSAAGFDANGRVDVGSWLGTAVTTSSTTSKPEVDAFSISDDATAANNAESCFTGTITTLDALDTAQDSQHSTTQGLIGTPSDFGSGTSTIAANLEDIADNGTASYDRSTDSLQAIRDRGDSAWTTGAGGSDRLLMVDTTIATLASQTSFTLTAGSADDDAYNGCTIVIEDASTSTQKAIGIVDDYTGSTKTVTLLEDPGVFTMATSDKVYILAEKGLKPTIAANYHVDVTSGGAVGLDWGNVENASTAVDLSQTDIQLCDTVTTNTDMRGTDSAFLAANAPTNFADLSITASTGRVDVASIEGSDATDQINAAADTALSDFFTSAAQLVDDIWDEALTGGTHNVATSAGRRLRELGASSIRSGTAQGGASNSITLDASASATDNLYDNNLIVIVGGTGAGQSRLIVEYDGTTKVAIVDQVWQTNPDNTSEFQIIADHQGEITHHGIAQAGTASTITLSSTASSQDDIYNDQVIALTTSTGTGQARRISDYNGTTKVATVSPDWLINPTSSSVYKILPAGRVDVDEIEGADATDQINAACDTALSDYDPPTRAELTSDIGTVTTAISNLNDPTAAAIATAVLTTQMTESYAADGVAPTLAQGIFAIHQYQADRAYAGTTLTVYQLDGTSTAYTATLDDGTNPTEVRRT